MSCCGQTITGAGAVALDSGKRVNYVQGMLLGVDDFVQEQAYHIARRQDVVREVLGYGTVRGLRVFVEPGTARVHVEPGVALTPSGATVCVDSDQCSDINAWLARNREEVLAGFGSPPASPSPLRLHVVLTYRDCAVDSVPIPGEPCRSDEDLMRPSRLADGFRLQFRLAAPPQSEEMAVREFADWLARIPLDSGSPPQSEADFMAALRAAAQDWLAPGSPPLPEDISLGSPPAGLETTDALLRAAFRLWVTELRPLRRARFGCASQDPMAGTEAAPEVESDALLLASLDMQVSPEDFRVLLDSIVIDESRRPVLLSLRMVQELIEQNPAAANPVPASPAPPPIPVPAPGTGVVSQLSYGQTPNVGVDSAYARADHSHGTPPAPVLAGDVRGAVGATVVAGLQGRAIAATPPNVGEVLALTAAGTWAPAAVPQASNLLPAALAFGGTGAIGTGALYARADHVHALPPLPALPPVPSAATTVPAPLSVGGTGAVGSDPAFARADHRHAVSALPPLAGDVTGALNASRVASLQGVALVAEKPVPGQTLVFTGKEWLAAGVATIVAGSVVLEVGTGNIGARVTVNAPNKASATASRSRLNQSTIEVRVQISVADPRVIQKGFSGQLTPVWNEKEPVLAYLQSVEPATGNNELQLSFIVFSSGQLGASPQTVQFALHSFVPA